MQLNLILPLPPSLNTCFKNIRNGRARVPTPEAIKWKREAFFIAKSEIAKFGWVLSERKTVVEIVIYWKDARKSDCDNRLKLMDTFNGLIWEDDHLCLYRFMDYSIDRKNPRMELKIYELEN